MSNTIISIIGGLGGMLGWGTSDFLANQASEKIGNFRTFFWSQLAGLALLSGVVFFFPAEFAPSFFLEILIAIMGISYGVGYLYFYKGFEMGNVSVVSAVINIQTLFIIGVAHFVFRQSLSTFQGIGIALILFGTLLVSVRLRDFTKRKVQVLAGVKETLIAAVLFGFLTWPIYEYVAERVNWYSVTFLSKLIAVATVFSIAWVSKTKLKLPRTSGSIRTMIISLGILEGLAILSTGFGVTYGDVIIVAPLSSALTVVTVALAVIFLKEKISIQQSIGIVLTLSGIILTAF